MFRRAAAAALALSLGGAALSACTPVTEFQGYTAVEDKPADVKVGEDSKSTVRARIGSPSVVSTFDPNIWFYMTQVTDRISFYKPRVRQRDIVAITFDKDSELVKTVNTYTLKDGKVIAYNGRETPTRGREMTILEQLLGNVGRGGLLPQDDDDPGARPGDRRN